MRRGLAVAGLLLAAVALLAFWQLRQRPRAPGPDYRPRPAGSVTFNRDIAPVIHRECSPCHRPGESAPFDLLTYRDVMRHATQIVEVTSSGYMPPWLPDDVGVAYIGVRRLAPDELGMIRQWVDEGTVEGDAGEPPPAVSFIDGWQLGEPDLVLEMARSYTMPASGEDVFRNFVFETGLEQTRYVRALEFRPAARKAVHHATIGVDRSPKSRFHDQNDPDPGFDGMLNSSAEAPDGHLVGWVPGKVPHEVTGGIEWPLEPQTDLVLQLHLQPTGKTETIRPRIGLYFADEPPLRKAYMIRLGPRTLDIGAGESDYVAEDSFVLPVDVEVMGLLPHAHYLGKRMEGHAIRPDGVTQPLIRIDDWDFNWQDDYRLVEPIGLPKGSTLFMRYTFDNSSENVRNPADPPVRVVFGPKTRDEMGDLWIQVVPRNAEDLAILEREFLRKEAAATHACYLKMLEISPQDPTVRYEFGEMLQRQGHPEQAIAHFEQVLALDPRHVPAHAALGRALLAGGDPGRAETHFRTALERMPELAEVHFNLGQALRMQGQVDAAVEEYRRALVLNEELVAAHHHMADVLRSGGAVEQAVAHYRTAIELDPEFAPAHNNLGSILAARGKLDRALEHFSRAVELDPSYAQAHNNLGMTLASRGAIDPAILHFRRALELRPDHIPTQRNLALAIQRRQAMKAQSDDSPK